MVDPAFTPFLAAGFVVGAIAVLEVLALLAGLDLFQFVEDIVPDVDGGDSPGLLSWLGFGDVPFMVLVVIILSTFAVAGICLQTAWMQVFGAGTALPDWLASVVAFAIGLPLSSVFANRLSRLIGHSESSGVSASELVGCRGEVTQGDTDTGASVEARVTDTKGNRHWIRVRAESGERLKKGDRIRIVGDRDEHAVYVARKQQFEEEFSPPG